MRALLLCLMLFPLLSVAVPFAACPDNTLTLHAGGARACAELAANEPQRKVGLMYRTQLAADGGMLFVFPQSDFHSMWMKDTLLPLSVAFLDDGGTIINIEDMQPRTLEPHGARLPARYALEMSLGWFKRRNLQPGMRIEGLPPAEGAR